MNFSGSDSCTARTVYLLEVSGQGSSGVGESPVVVDVRGGARGLIHSPAAVRLGGGEVNVSTARTRPSVRLAGVQFLNSPKSHILHDPGSRGERERSARSTSAK